MKERPIVGQRLFSLNIGKAARHRPQTLTPVTVMKVGRKYFACAKDAFKDLPNAWTEYRLEDWREKTQYCEDSALYVTEQEWEDKRESESICVTIADAFRHGNNTKKLPLETLRKIQELIA